MNLYLHVDRAETLKERMTLSNIKYPKGNSISILHPMIDKGFYEHIMKIYEEGISYHGYEYLVGSTKGTQPFIQWATEMYFEYIRYLHYPHLPSRLQSVFGWGNIEDALSFGKNQGKKASIYEISSDGNYFIGDMQLLKLNFDYDQQEGFARKYWEGKPLDGSMSHTPLWEYVINTPVSVVRRVI